VLLYFLQEIKVFASIFKGILHFFWKIGSLYNSLRVNQLSFTIIESIQPIF